MAKTKQTDSSLLLTRRQSKKTAQGASRNTNLAATPTRAKAKRYKGQGR